jgi:hypothetical protein
MRQKMKQTVEAEVQQGFAVEAEVDLLLPLSSASVQPPSLVLEVPRQSSLGCHTTV